MCRKTPNICKCGCIPSRVPTDAAAIGKSLQMLTLAELGAEVTTVRRGKARIDVTARVRGEEFALVLPVLLVLAFAIGRAL